MKRLQAKLKKLEELARARRGRTIWAWDYNDGRGPVANGEPVDVDAITEDDTLYVMRRQQPSDYVQKPGDIVLEWPEDTHVKNAN